MRVVVCDIGLGNLRSVERALREATRGSRMEVEVTREADRLKRADRLVMPGQGAFRDGSLAVSAELGDAVRAHLGAERPYLGICLGLQLLFESSEEAPGSAGMGVMRGAVVRLAGGFDATTGAKIEVPHVGWNTVDVVPGQGGLLGEGPPEHYYFVHSYAVVPSDPSVVAGTTRHGETFVSAVARGNTFACQFHPEKSGRAGIALLARFLAS